MQEYIIFKKSSKTYQKPSRYYNSITNLNFPTQAKISSFRNPHIKIDKPTGVGCSQNVGFGLAIASSL
jgi:hypothetical protein